MNEFLDTVINAVKRDEKTKPYDTTATVRRIDGNTAWCHIDGGVDETPVKMTIHAEVGDTVQVRVGGGTAFLVGNETAPPTDDKKANKALSVATNTARSVKKVQETVEEVVEEIEGLESSSVDDVTVQYCLSSSSSTFTQYGDWSDTPPEYESGYYYWTRTVISDDDGNETYGTPQYSQNTQLSVETDIAFNSNNNHFWYDSSGAYVTTANKNYSSGYATRITSSGILQSYNGNLLSSWTSSGISFYQGDSYNTPTASFGSGGAEIYSSGTSVASFGSTARIGANSGVHVTLEAGSQAGWLKFYNSSGTLCGRIESHSSGVRLTNNVGTYYSYYDVSDNGYLTLSAAHTVQIDATQNISIDASGMTFIDGDSGVVMNSPLTVYAISTFGGHIKPSGSSINCGTSSNPWNNCYVSTYFASTTAPSSLSQDYAVAWHKTSSNNYVLCRPSSSRKWKKDIEPISDAIADPKKLYDVRVVQFRYKDKNADDPNNSKYNPTALDVGFIAEEVAEAYPLGAVINENGEPDDWNARRIIPPMLALIQDQNKRITALEEKLS